MKIRQILHSGDVVRFHNHVGIDKQETAKHQWGAALIVQHIDSDCSKELLLAALTHDAAEYHTGDIPFPAKQANPELTKALRAMELAWERDMGCHFELSQLEKSVLKMADILEGMWFCVHQVRVGHINAKRPFRKWRKHFQGCFSGLEPEYPKAFELFNTLVQEMEEL